MNILLLESRGYSKKALDIYESIGNWTMLPEVKDPATQNFEIIVTRLAHQIDRAFLDQYTQCQYIVSPTTGLDHIDLALCKERGIEVISLKGESEFLKIVPATAELTWGLILSLVRHIPAAIQSTKAGAWDRDSYRGHDLKGRTIGIIGYGRVGAMVGRYAQAFGMRVLAYDRVFAPNVDCCSDLLQVLRHSDIVSIHLPLDPTTHELLCYWELLNIRQGGYLVNTSRGEILCEDALVDMLEKGHLAGAALDVVCNERGERNPRLLEYARTHDNLILTPHIGGATVESMERAEIFCAEKLREAVNVQTQ